jgi:hypothetical protein
MGDLMKRLTGLLLALAAGAASAATVHVTPTGDYWSAIYRAADGDVIVFAPGRYDALNFYMPAPHTTPIILQGGPGVLATHLSLDGAVGWTIEGFTFDHVYTNNAAVTVGNSSHVILDHVHIARADGYKGGTGFKTNNTQHVTLQNSEIDHEGTGGGGNDDKNLTFRHNRIHDIANDGIIVCGAHTLIVDDNDFKNFYPEVDAHPDVVQWCSTPTNQSQFVTISNNRYERGAGGISQGITGEYGSNIVIRGNAMLGTMYAGYVVCGVTNGLVDTNFLQSFPDMGTSMSVRCGSHTVSFKDNTAPLITDYTETSGLANTNVTISGTVPIGVAAQGDNSAYLAWIAEHQAGRPPRPPVDEIARLQAENAALRQIITNDSAAFATIRGALEQARPPMPTHYRKGLLKPRIGGRK